MKKRVVSLLLASVMALSVCACGSNKTVENSAESESIAESSTASESTEGTEVEEEPASKYPLVDEEVTLIGAVINGNTDASEDRLVWQAVEELTGVNIEWEIIDAESLNTYLAGSEWPDFILTQNGNTLNDSLMYDYGILGGRFVNILEHLDDMPYLTQLFEDYPEAKKAFTESNGEMYEFPAIGMEVTSVYSRPYMRTDVLEDAGCEVPETIDEFYDVLVKLKEHYGHEGWIYRAERDTNSFFPIVFGAFGTLTESVWEADENGKILFVRSSEQMKRYYEFMNKLYEEKLINQECFTIDPAAAKELELGGEYAFMEYGAEALSETHVKNGDLNYLTCLEPLTSEYDDTKEVMGRMSIYSRSGPYMNSDSEHVDLMCQIFDIMYATEEVAEGSGLHGVSFTYGIQGEHWDYDENGTTYSFYWPEKYSSFGEFQTKEIVWQNAGRSTNLAGLTTSTPGNSQVRQQAFAEKVWPYVKDSSEVFPGSFLKFTEDEQFVIDQYWSEIQTYYKEMQAKFITGAIDLESGWDEYLATLERMEIGKVIEVYQAAYDRWLAY